MPFIQLPDGYKAQVQLQKAWENFGAVVAAAASALAAKPDTDRLEIVAENGDWLGVVSGADVKRKFANLTWSLALADAGNGGVGEVESKFGHTGVFDSWISANARVMPEGVVGYAAWDRNVGLHYLALHETAHITKLGLETWYGLWTDYRNKGGKAANYPSSPNWHQNEQVANQIARSIGDWIGFDEFPKPPEGFPPMGRVHYAPLVA